MCPWYLSEEEFGEVWRSLNTCVSETGLYMMAPVALEDLIMSCGNRRFGGILS